MPTNDPGSPHKTAHAVEAAAAAKMDAKKIIIISPVCGSGHNSTATGERAKNSTAKTAWIADTMSKNGPTGDPIRNRLIRGTSRAES
jgi:hypothetical protein